ncbi:TRAP transporter small permease [Pelagibius sp. Alg239-R121]|uniref:TRAP transporter small permease n=1 Tax=Pelagibius sp. Alg239-R121 TaxID=2993448 RepID=UPI0024A67624|nr:TRAP transporter small permease subunit [Pelagibius sp. Alg239-R121]
MSSFFEGAGAIFDAILSGDSWMFADSLNHSAAYILGIFVVLVGGFIVMKILQVVPILDRHLERTILITSYLVIAMVIFVEVIRRFVFQVQAPWSTTLPPYLFLIMTWVGCAYNTRLRSHLSFSEFRAGMRPTGQLFCVCLDAVLWLIFALIVIVTTLKQTANSAANFQILLGTDNILQWWFYACVPASWLMLSARVIENLIEDVSRFRSGEPVVQQTAMISD